MTRVRSILSVAVVVSIAFVSVASAQSPVQLSLCNPVQIVPEEASVEGISLGIINTVNNNVTGINWTIFVNRVNGDMKGWQSGLVNFVEGETWGFQEGLFNTVEGDFIGWQTGFVNWNSSLNRGLQTGICNRTSQLRGVQFGFINLTDTLYGFQIGLFNMNSSGIPHGFLPIVNWSL